MVGSISWSLLSCVRMHTKLTALEKGFSKFSTQFFIFVWGTFATMRRVLSIIAMFLPSLGLFSVLHHWRWEQIPYKARLEYAKRGFLTSDDKIGLYGLNETIYWTELDRWNYTDPQDPQPPNYDIYTYLTLGNTFRCGLVLAVIHFLAVLSVKILASAEFRRRGHYTNKFLHVLQNINYAFPYSDWDEGDHSVQEFRARFSATVREMMATLTINIITTTLMMMPLWYSGTE